MLVTVSPSSNYFEETVNTLKYAQRAKNIRTKAVENKKLVEYHISEYRNIIRDLKKEIDDLKLKLMSQKELKDEEVCESCQKETMLDETEMLMI